MQDYLLPADNIFGYDVGYGRPYGIFQQPNVLASFMATTLILAGYLLQKIECKKTQAFLLLTVVLNIWVIVVTISRVAYLGGFISLLLFIPWAWEQNKKKLGLFIVAILIGIGCGALKHDMLKIRSGHMENITQDNKRVIKYSHTWSLITQHPFLGSGYGSFEKEYLQSYAEEVKSGKFPANNQHLTHPHNDTLFWAMEGGIVPVVGILLLALGLINSLKTLNKKEALSLLALITPIALHTQTEYPLYHSSLHWLVLIVLVFFISNEAQKTQQKTFSPTFALRLFALLIPLFTAVFMLTNLKTIAKITEFERTKNPDIRLLMDIINPLVFQDRFDFHLSYFRLNIAVQTDNLQELKAIIDWTEHTIEKTPKSYFYIILYLAYQHSNQLDKAKALLDYARYLYPKDAQLANIDKKPASQAQKTISQAQSTAQAMD
jgi:O-antigen polymerase